jgi:DNA-binding MarR family transcriptional regulator
MPLNIPRLKSRSAPGSMRHHSCTCGSLRKASRRVSQFYDTALAPIGLKSTQYSILAELERSGRNGGISMCDLADAMVMDRSTLGHNLRPLQRDNLLLLRLAVDDRRKRLVALTQKGKTTLQQAQRLWRTAEGRFEKVFGKRHAADLRRVLLNIAGNAELNSVPIQ